MTRTILQEKYRLNKIPYKRKAKLLATLKATTPVE